MGNSSRSPVRPYKNCTGQVWYVHWFPTGELRFGSKRLVCTVLGSMLTGIWVFSMEILYSYVNSSRSPVRPYKNCTGQVWYVHWFPSGELRFRSKRLVCAVLGSMLTGIWVFSMEILCISYGEFFKVTCTAVQELYRSSLVCPLILIRRATFWSKRLVRTVLGSMLTGIWVFSMEILYSYVNSSRSPVRPYKNCTGQVWYVHWFPSGELRFGPNG